MKNIHKKLGHLTAGLVMLIGLVMAGCSSGSSGQGKTLGTAIPADAVPIALASVLEKPAEFDGKTVVILGTVSGQCASFCEFNLKDGNSVANIFPEGFKLSKLDLGTKVTTLVKVTNGPERPVLSAIGMIVH